jgi:hypothetical protein
MAYVSNHYDYVKGWNDSTRWFECVITPSTQTKHEQMVAWLYEKLDNCERHCRWIKNYGFENESRFKFRYERDYILFTLRWS